MKRLVILLISIFLGTVLSAQQWVDVVYLENGSVIRGTIVEDIPNVSLSIQTADGSIFKCQYNDIIKLTKELPSAPETPSHQEIQAQRRWDTSSLKWNGGNKIVNAAGTVFTQPMMSELIGPDQATVLFDEIRKYNNLALPGKILIAPMLVGEAISLYFLFDRKNTLNIPKDPWLGIGIGLFAGTAVAETVLAVLSSPHSKKIKTIINDYRYSYFSYQIVPSLNPVLSHEGTLAYAPGLSVRLNF